MGTTSQKLSYLNETKGKLKDSINKFRNGITNQTTFRNYATELDGIYDLLPKIDNTDEELELLNVQNGKLDEFKMYGNTQQNNLDSNNVFDGALELGALDYNTGQNSVNNNSIRSKNYIPVSTTSFYFIREEAFSSGKTIALRYYDANLTYIGRNAINNFTQADMKYVDNSLDTSKSVAYFRFAISGETDTTQNFCVRTDGGTTYNPPKPNPEKPQQIEVVTGTNTIKINGKNLFDKDSVVSGFVNADGTIGGDTNAYRTSDFIPIQPNTAYYKTNTASPRTKYFDSNKQPLNTTAYQDISIGGSAGTFTTPNNAYYLRFSYPIASVDADSIQIEKGTSFTEYEPYQEQSYTINLGDIELCKIGDYQDYIYKNNGNWYKKAKVAKMMLDGSEANYAYSDSGTSGIALVSFPINDMKSGDYLDGLCDYFHNDKSGKALNSIRFGANDKRIYFYISNTIFNSLNDFKTWLSTHNTIVYYVLDTPTDTQITDTTLINQLEAISVFTGTNYFTISNLNNVLPNIYLKRLKQLDKLS